MEVQGILCPRLGSFKINLACFSKVFIHNQFTFPTPHILESNDLCIVINTTIYFQNTKTDYKIT